MQHLSDDNERKANALRDELWQDIWRDGGDRHTIEDALSKAILFGYNLAADSKQHDTDRVFEVIWSKRHHDFEALVRLSDPFSRTIDTSREDLANSLETMARRVRDEVWPFSLFSPAPDKP